ncbi:MAG: cytochrome c biogenesis protein CcsA [Nitrococcus mobilis]|nr:cytochrome c biogenesis protein CcsA [Nitrococcus mobilis]
MNHTSLTFIASGLYLAASTGLTLRLVSRPGGRTIRNASLLLALLAVTAHAMQVYQTTWTATGLNLSFFNAASLVGWLMAAFLLLATLRQPVENLGIVILPVAAVTALLSLIFGRTQASSAPIGANIDWHILFSMVAYSLLGIAAAQALLLWVQEYHLRNRHPGGFIRMLPALQTMEDILFQLLRLGFVVLTIALITGALSLDNILAQHLVHKTVLSITAWIVFAVLLFGHWRFGWRGRTAIRWTLGGFIALMLAYFGTKLVLQFILHR